MAQDRYDFHELETKWQETWEKSQLYAVSNEAKPKYFAMEMFPYPSGTLHMGNTRSYSIGDVIARFRRMQGFAVLHPMGFDAFGLPAENAAIEKGADPREWTEANIAKMEKQFKRLGFSYDWQREIVSCRPDYYKWSQYIFLLMYKRGLAYKKKAAVNWCPHCATVLANEQVIDGQCWRCDSMVEKRQLAQWFLKITDYADRLLSGLDHLPGWPDRVRLMQEHWIGRSLGAEIHFEVPQFGEKIAVFTTRPDTLFGVSYVVLAPEHPLVEQLIADKPERLTVEAFQERLALLSEAERTSNAKEGYFTGAYAKHPFTGVDVPIWVANYVIYEYGTGAVMGVPAHDQRDFEFAQQEGLPILEVVAGGSTPLQEAYTGPGSLINSGNFTGLSNEEAKKEMVSALEKQGSGHGRVQFHLRDWLVSRQRFWGTPIPFIYCKACGEVPVPEKNLPVLLPDVPRFGGDGSPLAQDPDFYEVACPQCGAAAHRETDTMDTFICSSWYPFRYISPHNDLAPFDREDARHWLSVDQYVGGPEHAVLHLLYARFFTMVLHDAGLLDVEEPFTNLLTQGMVLKDGRKMSKSKGNTVSPEEITERFGADAARLFILFAAPPERDLEWSDQGAEGAYRFLQRVWRLFAQEQSQAASAVLPDLERRVRFTIAKTVKKVGEDTGERYAFNTAVSTIMEFVNELYAVSQAGLHGDLMQHALERLALVMAPYTPHLSEEAWQMLGHHDSVHLQSWPTYDEADLVQDEVEVVIQVNGKLRDKMMLPVGLGREAMLRTAMQSSKIVSHLKDKRVVKEIVIEDKLVNLVVV